MFHAGLLDSLLIVLAVSIAVIGFIHRLRLSPILGYLLVGMLIGPGGLGWVHDERDIQLLGELGVVFLLFTIGLEFSVPRLLADSKAVLGMGSLQVVVTASAFALAGWLLGLPLPADIVIGAALAMSSTAMVVALLAEQQEIISRHGRQAVGILLFQDLSAMLFLMVIPALSGGRLVPSDILLPLAKGVLLLALLFFAGRWLLRPLFRKVAELHAPELFMLATLLASLGTARFAHLSGFSPALGGFMAGMVLGETEFRHQVEADIRPFQDVLLGLFFISIGMQVDLPLLIRIWPEVLMLAGGIILTKAAIVTGIARLADLPLSSALRTGVVLAQAGEFSLVLLSIALQQGILGGEAAQTILFAILLTMALTPLLVRFNASIAEQFCAVSLKRTRATLVEQVEEISRGLDDHVILCGYGRVGQNVAHFLDEEGFPYMALDLDPQRVRLARDTGAPVSYGNATRRVILEAAGIARARALVITFKDVQAALKVMGQVHTLRPDLAVLVRTVDDTHLEALLEAGATEVIPDVLEASLALVTHLLLLLGVPMGEVVKRTAQVRADRYRLLRVLFHEPEAPGGESIQVLHLPPQAYGVGRQLGALHLDDFGVKVIAVRRRGIRGEEPQPDMVFRAGDVLVLRGPKEGIERAKRYLLSGSP